MPKITVSELMRQEMQVQHQLQDEITRLREQVEINEIVNKELRRQNDELVKARYF